MSSINFSSEISENLSELDDDVKDSAIFLKSHHWANKTESDLSMY